MKKSSSRTLKKKVKSLFHERTKKSILFNRVLIGLNIAVFALFALEAFFPNTPLLHVLELVFGTLFALEYIARLWIAPRKLIFIFNIFSIIDLVVIVSLFAPFLVGNLALLRVLRSLKVLRTYYLVEIARKESKTVAQYQATITSALNFFVFLAIMTAIVFVAEAQHNPEINSYIDALYFTVATLTTTGYGDVLAVGPWGRLLSVVAMLIGITLFFRLTQTAFRGAKIHYTCPECGLSAHDIDATHCKHCGTTVKHKHFSHAL